MWKEALTAAWLIPMSIMDTKSKRVPVWMLWIGTAAAAGVLIFEGINEGPDVLQICRSLIPGIVLMVTALATGKAGMADGIILILLGALTGYKDCMAAALGGLLLIALLSVILLALRKVKRSTKIPFVPFLTVGWILTVCGRWMGQ